jgi:hypothetical protein
MLSKSLRRKKNQMDALREEVSKSLSVTPNCVGEELNPGTFDDLDRCVGMANALKLRMEKYRACERFVGILSITQRSFSNGCEAP